LRRVVVVIPDVAWNDSEQWVTSLRNKWAISAPAVEFYGVRLAGHLSYELIGTESRYLVLLPALSEAPKLEARKLLAFKRGEEWGIGSWLSRQMGELMSLDPSVGTAPLPAARQTGAPDATEDQRNAEAEELTRSSERNFPRNFGMCPSYSIESSKGR
jgi:hypothetical protein